MGLPSSEQPLGWIVRERAGGRGRAREGLSELCPKA